MKRVLRGHRKLRSGVLKKIQEDIRLEIASPQKRIKMREYLDYVSKQPRFPVKFGSKPRLRVNCQGQRLGKGAKARPKPRGRRTIILSVYYCYG